MHLNAGKRRTVQYCLLNDESLKDYTALAVVEPVIYQQPQTGGITISQDRHWQIFIPTTRRQDGHVRHAFRAALWVTKRCRATQIPVDSYDTVAVLVRLQDRLLFIAASYDPRDGRSTAARETALAKQSEAVRAAKTEAAGEPVDVLLCTDFNRHHELWGGVKATQDHTRQTEGEPIVDLLQELELQTLLPPGTIIWEHQSGDLTSTVDVIAGSEGIVEHLDYCRIHHNDYGSDHRPITLRYRGKTQLDTKRKGKRLYKDANWAEIRKEIGSQLGDGRFMKAIRDTAVFERAAAVFVNGINAILEKHVSRAKESPFAKRWWTKELTLLRQDFTSKRNRVTTLRRRGECTILLREASHAARRSYLDEIHRQKKQHWIDFLDDPDNLWKAASYAKPAGHRWTSRSKWRTAEHTRQTRIRRSSLWLPSSLHHLCQAGANPFRQRGPLVSKPSNGRC
jgi:hypothetical protein